MFIMCLKLSFVFEYILVNKIDIMFILIELVIVIIIVFFFFKIYYYVEL